MFDRISDSLTGGSAEAPPGELPDLLEADEELLYVLANDGSIEHTKQGRTTTVEPSGGESAYALITDERILYVLGDQPEAVEIEIDMRQFKASHHRKGLLSGKLQVKTKDEESVMFAPDDGDLEAAEDYVNRVASCWGDMATAIARARRAVSDFEDAVAAGSANDRYLDAKSNLSEARRCATRDPEAPGRKIRRRVDEVAAELAERHVDAWLDRAADRCDDIEPALDAAEYEAACTAYVDAAEALGEARDALEGTDTDLDEAADRLGRLETDVQTAAETFLDEAEAECETALDAEEPTVAVDAWEDAYERYDAVVSAGWNGQSPVSESAIELQLTWVTSSLLDALGSQASLFEQRADDCGDDDDAQAYYDDAVDWLERAESLAAEHPEHSPAEFSEAADRVEEKKLDRSGWEFGAEA